MDLNSISLFLGIVSVTLGGIWAIAKMCSNLFHRLVITPIYDAIQEFSENLKTLYKIIETSTKSTNEKLERQEHEYQDIRLELKEHDIRIKELEKDSE